MILEYILRATFRVVACIKGECVELPRFPRVSFSDHSRDILAIRKLKSQKGGLDFSDVLWCC
ncbi:MAG: hypothetical protein P8O23_05320 [Opitutales bacterium]|nr:hypothetical protein [Opitutales bacterium]